MGEFGSPKHVSACWVLLQRLAVLCLLIQHPLYTELAEYWQQFQIHNSFKRKCQNWPVLSIRSFSILPTNNLNYKIALGLVPFFPGKITSLALPGGETLRDVGVAGAYTCVNGHSYTEQISLKICWSLLFTNRAVLLIELCGATAFDLLEDVSWCSIT